MLVIETRCEIPKQSHCQDEKYARNMLVWAHMKILKRLMVIFIENPG